MPAMPCKAAAASSASGTSLMTPAQVLVDLWPRLHDACPDIRFQLIPFDNTPENAREILANLCQNIDVVAGIFDETMLSLRNCAGARAVA